MTMNRIFTHLIYASCLFGMATGAAQASSDVQATARSASEYSVTAADGSVNQFRDQEAIVYSGEVISSTQDNVVIETMGAGRFTLGAGSEATLTDSGDLRLNRGQAVTALPADRPSSVYVGDFQIVPARANGSTASFFVATREDLREIFVYAYDTEVLVLGRDGADRRVLAANYGSLIATDDAGRLQIRLMQSQNEDETETKRPLFATAYRAMEPEYVVQADENNPVPPSSLGWTVENGLLQNNPGVATEPIKIAIPVKGTEMNRVVTEEERNAVEPTTTEGDERGRGTGWVGPHMVRAHIRTSADHNGVFDPTFPSPPTIGFRMRFEDGDSWESFYYDPNNQNANFQDNNPNSKYYDPDGDFPNDQFLDLGVVNLVDGILDVEIDSMPAPLRASIIGFDFSPVGLFWTPADEVVDDQLVGGPVGDEAVAATREDDVIAAWLPGGAAGTIAVIGGVAALGVAGAVVIDELDDDDDDDDTPPVRPPTSPTRPRPPQPIPPVETFEPES